jgi:hypothetical protein
MYLAHLMGGVEYDQNVREILDENPGCQKIANDILTYMQNEEKPDLLHQVYAMSCSREHWLDAVGFALYAVFHHTPPQRSGIGIPRPLRPIYSLTHPLVNILK